MVKNIIFFLIVTALVLVAVIMLRTSPQPAEPNPQPAGIDPTTVVARLNALGQFETASTTITDGNNRGTITAGVDLTGVTGTDFAISGKHIQLNLAAPQLFKMTLNAGTQDGLRHAVCAGDILSRASDNAAKLLGELLKSLGFTGTLVMINEPISC